MQPDFSKQRGEQKCQRLCALRNRALALGSYLSKTGLKCMLPLRLCAGQEFHSQVHSLNKTLLRGAYQTRVCLLYSVLYLIRTYLI